MAREFVEQFATGGLVSRRWDRGPLAATASQILEGGEPRQIRALWSAPRKRGFEFKALPTDARVKLSWFETWSLQDELPAEVLTLEVGDQIRAAVAVILHDGDQTFVSDLFVWPPYRRQGLGTCLDTYAGDRAQAAGTSKLLTYVWEADAVRGLDRASQFLASRGYAVTPSNGTEFVMFGERALDQCPGPS